MVTVNQCQALGHNQQCQKWLKTCIHRGHLFQGANADVVEVNHTENAEENAEQEPTISEEKEQDEKPLDKPAEGNSSFLVNLSLRCRCVLAVVGVTSHVESLFSPVKNALSNEPQPSEIIAFVDTFSDQERDSGISTPEETKCPDKNADDIITQDIQGELFSFPRAKPGEMKVAAGVDRGSNGCVCWVQFFPLPSTETEASLLNISKSCDDLDFDSVDGMSVTGVRWRIVSTIVT